MNDNNINLEESNTEIEEYSCPNCDGALEFNPDKQELCCKYCGFGMPVDGKISDEEHDFLNNIEDNNTWNLESKVVHCDNCGSNTVIDNNEISFSCPFCGSNSVAETNELSGIKPHRVVPFKVSNEFSLECYSKWLKKKFFAPKKVKKEIPSLKLRGVYLPVWTFDTNTISLYKGRLGKHYTTTVGSGKNKRTVTKTRYFYISGTQKVDFDDLIINAGTNISQNEIDQISPFNTNDSYLYEKGYLVGFSAEHYTVKLNTGWENSKLLMKKQIERRILSRYSYDVVSYLNVNTSYNEIKYKYVLIPIWVGTYNYNNKKYRFISNGETGKSSGKYPVSPFRVTLLVLLCIMLLILFVYLFNF